MAFMGYETPVEAPQMRIYNTDLMKMYIAGVKEQYDQSREDYKDFMKSYSDFYSPIANDTERYNDATINAVSNFVGQMGPDLFRTPEGQAAITRLINSVPVGELNKIKQSAEIAKEYVKNRGELMAKGLWNPEYEKWRLGGRSLEDWDTSNDGMWTNYSPAAFQDWHTFTDDWFKHLEPQLDEEYTAAKNDVFDYYRVSEKDLRNVISGRLNDVIKDGGQGQFFYEQMLDLANGDHDLARELFTQETVSRNSDYYREKKEADPYTLARYNASLKGGSGRGNGGGGVDGNPYGSLYQNINIYWSKMMRSRGDDIYSGFVNSLKNTKNVNEMINNLAIGVDGDYITYAMGSPGDKSGTYSMNTDIVDRLVSPQQLYNDAGNKMHVHTEFDKQKIRNNLNDPDRHTIVVRPRGANGARVSIVPSIDADGRCTLYIPVRITDRYQEFKMNGEEYEIDKKTNNKIQTKPTTQTSYTALLKTGIVGTMTKEGFVPDKNCEDLWMRYNHFTSKKQSKNVDDQWSLANDLDDE